MTPRTRMGFSSLIAAIIALTFATRAHPQPREASKAKDELKQLQGVWTLRAYIVDGRTLRGEDARSTLTVEDDRWTETWQKDGGGTQVEQGVVRIIDAEGRPKIMDLVHDFGPYKGTTTRVLYQIEGDSMRYSILVVPASIQDGKVVTATTTWKRKSR